MDSHEELVQKHLDFQRQNADEEERQSQEKRESLQPVNVTTKPRYKKKDGSAGVGGVLFEIGVCGLLAFRARNAGIEFQLACNMKAAASFDDVVLKIGNESMFLQLKYRKNMSKNLYISQLIQLEGDFSIFKYYKSYCKIKENWSKEDDLKQYGPFSNVNFIVYTNMKSGKVSGCGGGSLGWQNILNSGGNYFSFSKKTSPDIYNIFQNIPRYKQLLQQAIENKCPDKKEVLNFVNQLWNKSGKTMPDTKELEKYLNQLNSLGDLTGYEHFLSHLWYFTGQTSGEEMDNAINHEIKIAFGTSNTQSIFKDFMKGIQTWQNTNFYLTSQTKLWQDIALSCITNINEETLKQLNIPDLHFNDTELNSIRALLPPVGTLHITNKGGDVSTAFSCLKVHESLANISHLFVNSTILQTHQTEVLALWYRWCNVLVVVVDDENGDINILTNDVDSTDNRLLLIIGNVPSNNSQYKYAHFADNTRFLDLDRNSQDKLLASKVDFQGHLVPFGKIIDTTRHHDFTADVIVQLNEKLKLGDALKYDVDYYLPRTLQLQDSVKDKILLHKTFSTPVTLAVSGLDPEVLAHQYLNHCNNTMQNKCSIEVTETEEEFIELADKNSDVHWLHYEKDVFKWKQSKGDVNIIKEYGCNKHTTFTTVNSVMDIPNRLVILSAEPGMGKSTLLRYLAYCTKKNNPATWVISENLNNFSGELHQLPDNLEMSHVVEFLLKISKIPSDFEPFFRHRLESMDDICILLDGYDEICPSYADKVTLMLCHLQKTKVRKLWVTTRPNTRENLEQKLSSLSFSLQPFSEKDQIDFLSRLWSKKVSGTDCDVHKFTIKLLDFMNKSLNNTDRLFTGIPLQCMLLAEAFERNLMTYSQKGEIDLPQKLNLVQLFDRFIERKFDIHYEKMKLDTKMAGSIQTHKILKENFCKDYMLAAMLVLFPENSTESNLIKNSSHLDGLSADRNAQTNVLQKDTNFMNRILNGSDKIGIIVEIVNCLPIFIHRTFAEYFAAHWFARNYEQISNSMKVKLLEPKLQVLRHFLDRILHKNFPLHDAVTSEDRSLVEALTSQNCKDVNVQDMGGRTALFLAVMNYIDVREVDDEHSNARGQILHALLEKGAHLNVCDKVFGWKPVHLAVKIETWYAVGLLLQKSTVEEDLNEIMDVIRQNINNCMYVDRVLKVATKYGFIELVKIVLKCGIHVSYQLKDGYKKYYMLHRAAQYRNTELVKFLVKKCRAEIDVKDNMYFRTPMMVAAEEGWVEIVEYLIDKGANINAKDVRKSTALLRAAECGRMKVVELLLKKTSKPNYDQDGNNILNCAAMSNNSQLVQFLLTLRLKVNYHNHLYQTPLWLASRHGRLSVVKLLLRYGANLHKWDRENGFRALHIAAMWGHLEVVKCLVQSGANVNVRDKKGCTPLERAKKYKHSDVVEYLTEHDFRDWSRYFESSNSSLFLTRLSAPRSRLTAPQKISGRARV